MAGWYDGAGGGSSSSGGWYAPPKKDEPSKKKRKGKKKKKDHKFGFSDLVSPEFYGNMASDFSEGMIGALPGVGNAIKGGVSDTVNLGEYVLNVGDGRKAFKKDEDGISDIGLSILKGYNDLYGDMAPGFDPEPWLEGKADLRLTTGKQRKKGRKHFRQDFYDHPLGPILDVLTVVTLGGAGAGKVAQLAAKSGSKTGAKVAGLERVAVPEGIDPAEFATKEWGRTGRKAVVTKGGEVLAPKQRRVYTSGRKDSGGTQGAVWEGRAHQNPVIRARQAAFDTLSELFPQMKVIGADRRAGRQKAQRTSSTVGLDEHASGVGGLTSDLGYFGALRGIGDVDDKRFDPLVLHATQNEARRVTAEERGGQLETDTTLAETLGADRERAQENGVLSGLEREAAITAKVLAEIGGRRLGGESEPATVAAQRANEAAGHFQDVGARARKEGRSAVPAANDLADARMGEAIAKRVEAEGVDAVTQDLTHRLYLAENTKLVVPKMRAELEHQRKIAANELTDKQWGLVNKLLKHYERIGDATTARLNEAGLNPRADIDQLPQEIVGVPKGERVPAIKLPDRTESRQLGGPSGGTSRLKNPTRPGASKFNTGISYRTAQQLVDPKVIAQTYKEAATWKQTKQVWQSLLDSSIVNSKIRGDVDTRDYELIDGKKFEAFIRQAGQWLDEEAPIAFGDSPILSEMQSMFIDGFGTKFKGQQEVWVPKQMHRRIMGEIEQSNKVLTGWIDKPTAIWRTATLTIRPAFYANNLFGQTALLLISHGFYKTLRTGIQYAADGKARAAVDAKSGGALMGSQAKFMSRDTDRLLKDKSFAFQVTRLAARTARDLTDFMGRVGGAITDDPIRRMAFLAEVRGPAKQLQKQKGITFAAAVDELLQDPVIVRRVEEKVLGDLVDFSNLNPHEREIVRRAAPFYSWTKGSSKRAAQLILDDPLKANVLTTLGSQYAEDLEDDLGGGVPDFLLGAIPVDLPGKNKKGERDTIVTSGFSPLSTPADVVGMGASLFGKQMPTGGQNPISHLNPLFQVPIEALLNKESFSGEQINTGDKTLAGQILGAAALSTPIASGGWNYYQKSKDPERNKRALYRASLRNEAFKFLGVPERQMNVDTALAIGDGPRPNQLQVDQPDGPDDVTGVRGPDGRIYYVRQGNYPKDDPRYVPAEKRGSAGSSGWFSQ